MASVGAFRAMGKEFGIVNVMVTLFKAKTPLTAEKLRTYLLNSSILTALKQITDREDLSLNDILAIFRLSDLPSRSYSLDDYYKLLNNMSPADRNEMNAKLAEGSDLTAKTALDRFDVLLRRSSDVPPPPSLSGSASGASSAVVTKSTLKARPREKAAVPPSESGSAATASTASALTALSGSTSTALSGSTSTALSGSTSTSTSALTALSGSTSTSTASASTVSGAIGTGFKIHIKEDKINVDKYEARMLNSEHNSNAKLLIVDIESCQDVIYPVAIDLPPGSTNRDLLANVSKVLTEASAKNLKCHTALHVYTVKMWNSTDRVTYVKI